MFLKRVALLFGLMIALLALATLVCGLAFGIPQLWLSSSSQVKEPANLAEENKLEFKRGFASIQVAEAVAEYQVLDNPIVITLQKRLKNLEPNPDGSYQISVTESEINEILAQSPIITMTPSGVQLQNPSVTLSGGTAVIKAKVSHPFSAELRMSVLPTVTDGEVRLSVENASLGTVHAPDLLLVPLQTLVNEALDQALASVPESVELIAINIEEGQITVSGRQL